MSASLSPDLTFTDDEITLLGHTADALSAWMGKPVLAEVIDATETGFEWVVFAIPLLPEQNPNEVVQVQLGGPGARHVGNKGGLDLDSNTVYSCELLWIIQLSDIEGIRYIKVDTEGEEVAWANSLQEMLPFDVYDDDNQEDEMQ